MRYGRSKPRYCEASQSIHSKKLKQPGGTEETQECKLLDQGATITRSLGI